MDYLILAILTAFFTLAFLALYGFCVRAVDIFDIIEGWFERRVILPFLVYCLRRVERIEAWIDDLEVIED